MKNYYHILLIIFCLNAGGTTLFSNCLEFESLCLDYSTDDLDKDKIPLTLLTRAFTHKTLKPWYENEARLITEELGGLDHIQHNNPSANYDELNLAVNNLADAHGFLAFEFSPYLISHLYSKMTTEDFENMVDSHIKNNLNYNGPYMVCSPSLTNQINAFNIKVIVNWDGYSPGTDWTIDQKESIVEQTYTESNENLAGDIFSKIACETAGTIKFKTLLDKGAYAIKIYENRYIDGQTVYFVKTENEELTPNFIENTINGQIFTPVNWNYEGVSMATISLNNHSSESIGTPLTATYNNVSISINIVIVEIQLKEIMFKGEGYNGKILHKKGQNILTNTIPPTTIPDNSFPGGVREYTEDVNAPHWSIENGSIQQPFPFLAVAKGSELEVSPYFTTNPEVNSGADLPFVKIKSVVNFGSESIQNEQNYLTFDEVKKMFYFENSPNKIKINISNEVKIISDFNIEWSVKNYDSPTPIPNEVWTPLIISNHGDFYQTFQKASYVDEPEKQDNGYYLEYGYYFGCKKIEDSGQIVENSQQFINSIWNEFSDRKLYKNDFDPALNSTDPLKYHYGNVEQCSNLSILYDESQNGSGECGAFQFLFISILKSHGIEDISYYTIIVDNDDVDHFIVKSWDFDVNGIVSEYPDLDQTFTHLNIPYGMNPSAPTDGAMSQTSNSSGNNRYTWIYEEVVDKIGIEAQGYDEVTHDNPWSAFGRHKVVQIGNSYYDPSYGKIYTSIDDEGDLTSFRNQAVEGFYIQIPFEIDETIFGNVDTDPTLVNDADWSFFLFVKESEAFDIKLK